MTIKMTTKRIALVFVALAVTASLIPAVVAADEFHHEGCFLGMKVGRITILNRDGTMLRSFPLADLVQVTRNGRPANLSDLVSGDLVQLTTELRLQQEYVIVIAAITRE